MATKTKKKLITQAEYGRLMGVSKQRVGKYIEKGYIKKGYAKSTKLIDPEIASEELAMNIDPAQSPNSRINNADGIINFATARAQKMMADAEMAILTLNERKGIVVNAKDVRNATYNAYRKIRDSMLSVPDRVVAEVLSIFGVDVSDENTNKGRKIMMDIIEKALEQGQGKK